MYNKTLHRRRSVRLDGHDYSSPDYYFVTICTQDKKCLFGHIADGEVRLNKLGRVVQDVWKRSEEKYNNIKLHEFIIMSNHMHGIIEITATETNADAWLKSLDRAQCSSVGAHPCAHSAGVLQQTSK